MGYVVDAVQIGVVFLIVHVLAFSSDYFERIFAIEELT